MVEHPPQGPDGGFSIEEMLRVPFTVVLDRWEAMQPVERIEPQLIARAPQVFDALARLTDHPALDRLRHAVELRDPRALGSLAFLAKTLARAADTMHQRCKRWRQSGDWTTLRREADLASVLARATGEPRLYAECQLMLATARRRLGDLHGAIAPYREAVRAAEGDDCLLGVAHDNLGLTLAEEGHLDEALDEYAKALQHESDPRGVAAILQNRALALAEVGELDRAVRDLEAAAAGFERAGVDQRHLAIVLDNIASVMAGLGRHEAALHILERARELFPPRDVGGRVVNALNRAARHLDLEASTLAAEAFQEAHDLAFQQARAAVDPAHYQRGFHEARTAALPSADEAVALVVLGAEAKNAGLWQEALRSWTQASRRAREMGDHALALRTDANIAALLYDRGALDEARVVNQRVAGEAASRGIARPELMAIGNLGSLAAAGAENVAGPAGSLGLFARCAVLLEAHMAIVSEAGLDAVEAHRETYDTGAVANSLAILAEKHEAQALAVRYYREAVQKARATGERFSLINRLAGLRKALAREGDREGADVAARELATLAAVTGDVPPREALLAHQALGDHHREGDRKTEAIVHYREAAGQLERWRLAQRPGAERTQALHHFPRVYRALARLLRHEGAVAASYAALLGEKGRRLIDRLATLDAREGPTRDDAPTSDEIQILVGRLGCEPATVLVEFAIEEDRGITAYLVGGDGLTTVHVAGDPRALARVEHGDSREREARLVRLCLATPMLMELAESITAVVPEGRRLMLVPDGPLHNLPLHLIPVRGRPWCDGFEISYLTAAGALRFADRRLRALHTAFVGGDSRGDLPHAAAECRDVAALLSIPACVGADCSRAAIESALHERPDIVHLAVHGRGDPKRGARASVLLAAPDGDTEWVPFDGLTTMGWRARLVVFSGCSTAVAGRRDGRYLSSVADAAAETGAAAVIACLWPVEDSAARTFMTAFYAALVEHRAAGRLDLRDAFSRASHALRQATDEIAGSHTRRRDGRTASDQRPFANGAVERALIWAPFILVGDPIVEPPDS
jgi:CHAT domain-containing protein/tetratricopeptide (TPR) repeat protein